MKRARLTYERRQLLKASEELRKMFPPTPEQKLLIDAAINLRAAKGAFIDAYTAEELDMLAQARRTAMETGQTKVVKFVTTHKRIVPRLLKIPPEKGVHACPQCGEMHRDSGVKDATNWPAIQREEALLKGMMKWFSSAQFRLEGVRRVRKFRRLKRKKAQEQA